MKRLLLVLVALAAIGSPSANAAPWQPTAGHTQVPIWPGAMPYAKPAAGPETVTIDKASLIAGKTVVAVSNVSKPSFTVYAPTGKNTGAAVVVLPGGGYEILAMDLEGTEVCDWLTAHGITAVLLKYRVPGHPGPHRTSPMALADAQRTLGLLRFGAAQWKIDPHKIGVLGFSAGGHLAAALSTQFARRSYRAVDAADKVSCRPDFAVPIYPGHLAVDASDEPHARRKPPKDQLLDEGGHFGLNLDIRVTKDTPPTLLLQNEDDPVDRVENSLLYYMALRDAGVPVEMHLYAHGGHAFGLRPTKLPVSRWPSLLETWLHTIGMVAG